MRTPKPEYYLGTISKILDPDKYEVEITVPGMIEGAKAYPLRGEVDEPKCGDVALILGLDPVYHSVYFYQRLKENEFIGFRSRGKKVDITKERIDIGIFSEVNSKDMTSAPYEEDSTPASTSWIKIDESGNLDINMEANQNIHISGDSTIKIDGKSDITIGSDSTIKISGNSNIEISGKSDVKISSDSNITVSGNSKLDCSGNVDIKSSGNATIKASGNAKVEAPQINIKGSTTTINGGTIIANNGSVVPTGTGPFCGLPACLFTGAPHSGNMSFGS